jgi:uncharacterized RDD family membrane protein YckC
VHLFLYVCFLRTSQMNSIKIITSQNIELEYELASLGERIIAWIVDTVILAAYIVIVLIVFLSSGVIETNTWLILLFFIPPFFYHLVTEIMMNGQSIGKRVMNIKVISLDGGQATLGQYIIRWLFRFIDFTLTNCLCALISVAVSQKKQRVGDMVAGTTLIKTVPKMAFQQTLYVPTEPLNYSVTFPEVANLSDSDMQLIKEVMITVNKSGNSMLAYQAAQKIKDTLNVQSNLEPISFLQELLADYNYLTSRE